MSADQNPISSAALDIKRPSTTILEEDLEFVIYRGWAIDNQVFSLSDEVV